VRNPMNFTTRAIEDLDLIDGESDVWVWDCDAGKYSGLGIRMRRGKLGASKTWYASYGFGGQDRRDRLGDVADYTLADARHRVYEIRKSAADLVDPRAKKAEALAVAVKAVNCPSFAVYAEHYLRRKQKDLRPNTYRERVRYLAAGPHLEPFKKLRLDQIDKAMVAARINFLEDTGITKPSPVVAQAARMALLDLFKLAIAEGHVEDNPVTGTRQPAAPKQQEPRERTLADDELAALWQASGDGDYGRITRLAILLGGRRKEIGGMRWSEIDAAGNWTLPGDRAKNEHPLVLPLPAAALDIIRSVKRCEDRDHLFGGRSPDGFTLWSNAKRKLDARLALKPWRFHDLRRSLVTGMHELGIEPHVVKAVVNHQERGDVHNKHYNRATYLPQKAEALGRWSEHVLGLVAGANVVELPRAA